MLMTIDVGRRAAQAVLEGIQLRVDLAAQGLAMNQSGHAGKNQAAERVPGAWQQWAVGQVQVQAGIKAPPVAAAQFGRTGQPGLAAHHATDGLQTPSVKQGQDGLVDALAQPKVVRADAQQPCSGILSRLMHTDPLPAVATEAPFTPPARRIGRFIIVGCCAAAVHWAAVVWLVSHWGVRPALANLPAWLVAFGVSFVGHQRWTFGDRHSAVGRSAPRFFLVSALGFAVNEAAYVALLHWGHLRYDLGLGAVLIGVAALTYLASRHWAFLGSQAG